MERSGEDKSRFELGINKLTSAVHRFIEVYCSSFETNFNLSQSVARGQYLYYVIEKCLLCVLMYSTWQCSTEEVFD